MKSGSNCSSFKTSPKLYQALILVFGNHSGQDFGHFSYFGKLRRSCTEKLLFKGRSVGMMQQGGAPREGFSQSRFKSPVQRRYPPIPQWLCNLSPIIGSQGKLATFKTEF